MYSLIDLLIYGHLIGSHIPKLTPIRARFPPNLALAFSAAEPVPCNIDYFAYKPSRHVLGRGLNENET